LGKGFERGGTLAVIQGSNSTFPEELSDYTLRRSITRIEGKRTVTYVVCVIYDVVEKKKTVNDFRFDTVS